MSVFHWLLALLMVALLSASPLMAEVASERTGGSQGLREAKLTAFWMFFPVPGLPEFNPSEAINFIPSGRSQEEEKVLFDSLRESIEIKAELLRVAEQLLKVADEAYGVIGRATVAEVLRAIELPADSASATYWHDPEGYAIDVIRADVDEGEVGTLYLPGLGVSAIRKSGGAYRVQVLAADVPVMRAIYGRIAHADHGALRLLREVGEMVEQSASASEFRERAGELLERYQDARPAGSWGVRISPEAVGQ